MDLCELVRKHIYCSIVLEKLVSELLSLYSEKIKKSLKDKSILLKVVSIESMKHAKILDLLAKELGLYVEYGGCRDFVGEPWVIVENLLNELRSGREIDLKKFIEKQTWIEHAVGEETYHKLLLPLISSREVEEKCLNIHTVKVFTKILDKLTLDEKYHEEILKSLE
jgi:hypothetical protein